MLVLNIYTDGIILDACWMTNCGMNGRLALLLITFIWSLTIQQTVHERAFLITAEYITTHKTYISN